MYGEPFATNISSIRIWRYLETTVFVFENDTFSYLKQTYFWYLKTVRLSYLKIAHFLYLKTAKLLYLEATRF